MRPAGKGELESLYFDYPRFDAPAREGLATETPVLIVGAGPIGMVAALTLARYGVRSVLVEARETFNDGSRAICVARTSFDVLEMLGVEQPFIDKALPYLSGRSFFRGNQILHFEMQDPETEKYSPMYNIQQQFIEAYLYEGVARSDLIDMRWRTRCEALEDAEGGVVATLSDPAGEYQIRAEWVLAADGARSAIRRMRGKRLKGNNFEGRYVIADIRMRHPIPVERIALFDPDRRPGSTVLVHQQPDDIWRLDYQVREGETEDEALTEAAIREGCAQVLAECGYDAPWELEWWSLYSANTLALDDYRDGRLFFIGDSAHIVPIFGVRGFNNGVLDGNNIGWKLAYVLNGLADPALLDTYSPERRGATLDVFEKSSKSAQFMTPRSRGFEILRDAALSLAIDHEFAGWFANPRNMTPYAYADSPLTRADQGDWTDAPEPGAAAPNARVEGGFLLSRLGPHFTVLTCGAVEGVGALAGDLIEVLPLAPGGEAAEIYGMRDGDACLIRPDHFIGARWRGATAEAIREAVDTILMGGEP